MCRYNMTAEQIADSNQKLWSAVDIFKALAAHQKLYLAVDTEVGTSKCPAFGQGHGDQTD